MAIIILRTRASEHVQRKGVLFDPELRSKVRDVVFKLFEDVGVRRWNSGRSSDGCLVHILEGTQADATMIEQVLSASAAYSSVSFEILENIQTVVSRAARVQKLAASFNPPQNQDEIDRMLLEE